MKKTFLAMAALAAMTSMAAAQSVQTAPNSATNANVPTGYMVQGATWYRLDRWNNHKVVQIPDLLSTDELRKAMQDPAHPRSMVRGNGDGGGGSGGN